MYEFESRPDYELKADIKLERGDGGYLSKVCIVPPQRGSGQHGKTATPPYDVSRGFLYLINNSKFAVMEKLLFASVLFLMSCQKQERVCTCYNETWKRAYSNQWKFDSKGDNFKDFCANDRKMTKLSDDVYLVQKCFE